MEANVKKFLLFATPYSFIVAMTYNLGYWTTFDVDVFSFLSIDEIVISAVIPLSICLFIGLIYVGGTLTVSKGYNALLQNYFDISIQASRTRIIILCIMIFIIIFCIISYAILVNVWYLVPVFPFIVLISLGFIYKESIYEYYFSSPLLSITLFSALFLIFFSFWIGKEDALSIKDQESYTYVLSDDLESTNLVNGTKLIYLGEAGDYFFFQTDSTKNILIKKIDSFQDLIFYKKEEE